MLCRWSRTSTEWASRQWPKSLTRSKARARTCSWWRWATSNSASPSRISSSSLSGCPKPPTIAPNNCSSNSPCSSIRNLSQDEMSMKGYWNSYMLRRMQRAKIKSHSWAGATIIRNMTNIWRKCSRWDPLNASWGWIKRLIGPIIGLRCSSKRK